MSGESDGGAPPRRPDMKPDVLGPGAGRLTIGARRATITTPTHRPPPDRKMVEAYDYKDAAGNTLYQVVRFDPKSFRQRKPDGSGGWIWDPTDLPLVLYRLPEVIAANTVIVLEGEKDVETAYRLGLPSGWAATSCPFGTRWVSVYGEMLRGKNVVLCPDSDASGQLHLRRIGRDLVGKVTDMRLIVLPDQIKDLSQWAEGKTKEQFAALLESARPVDFPP
jgi:hypothetical protein